MQAAELEAKLEELTTEASESYDSEQQATRTHWRALVRAYLFWAECQTIPGFLDAQYKAHNIRSYALGGGNKPNFNPLLKLVFRKSLELRNDPSRIGQRAAALSALHAEYTDSPQRYRKDPEARLFAFWVENGGIAGLMARDQLARDVREGREGPDGDDDQPAKEKLESEFGDERLADVRKAALEKARTSSGLAEFIPQRPVRVGRDNLLVLLAERRPDGTVAVLGSTNDASVLDETAFHAADYTLATLPKPFRVLVETVRTQVYPAIALSKDLAVRKAWETKYSERSHITNKQLPTWDGKGRAERLRVNKKLLIRASDQSLLLSLSACRASVVTVCKPENGAFPYHATKPEPLHRETALEIRAKVKANPKLDEDALVLASNQYHYEPMGHAEAALEHRGLRLVERMLETSEVFSIGFQDITANFAGYGRRNFVVPAGGFGASYKKHHRWLLRLKRGHEEADRLLSFYDTWRDAGAVTGFQPQFDFANWTPDWQVDLEPVWFAQLREKLLDPWFLAFGAGTQVARASNKAMRLSLGSGQLTFEYNFDVNRSTPGATETMPVPTEHEASWLHVSRDIGTVLYNLADAETVGTVSLSGTANAIVLAYATAVGQFRIAVPCASIVRNDVVRNEAAFSEYQYG